MRLHKGRDAILQREPIHPVRRDFRLRHDGPHPRLHLLELRLDLSASQRPDSG